MDCFQAATTKTEGDRFVSWQWVSAESGTCYRVTAGLSITGHLWAWLEPCYNPVMQLTLLLSVLLLLWLCFIALVMLMRTSALTPTHLHRIMATIPDPTYREPCKSQIAPFKSAALSYCKSGQTPAQMLFTTLRYGAGRLKAIPGLGTHQFPPDPIPRHHALLSPTPHHRGWASLAKVPAELFWWRNSLKQFKSWLWQHSHVLKYRSQLSYFLLLWNLKWLFCSVSSWKGSM